MSLDNTNEDDNIEDEKDIINPLSMSDEDILNTPEPEILDQVDDDKNEDIADDDEKEDGQKESNEEEEELDTELDIDSSTRVEEDDDSSEEEVKKEVKNKGKKVAKKDPDVSKEDSQELSNIDYKQEYNRLLAPFKANGKNIQISSVDDALQLMKMGANYNKKMAGLKPNFKLLKMLENNGLLNEDKLSYLIDLDKKDPEAINKLIKDSGVDPLDIDTEKSIDYKPKTYTVDDKEVELDEVLDDIRDTPTFKDTIDTISNKWDDASKQVLLEQPTLIKVINNHISEGIYGQIMEIVDNERVLGRLTELSDLDAYKRVGDALQANGAFSAKAGEENNTDIKADKDKVNSKLKDRKRAASSTKGGAGSKSKKDFNPLSMSDEEFEKIATSQYM